MKTLPLLPIIVIAFIISGCGGGGGGSSNTTPPPINTPAPDPIPTFQAGVFQTSANFDNQCQAPRTGINPGTGAPYLDQSGSLALEKEWLRSWNNELYLWYNEVTDRNPAPYSTPIQYFDQLKTVATSPSGNPKDQFHFTFDSEEWYQLTRNSTSVGYGINFSIISGIPPRKVVIAYIEPGSPADNLGIKRGAEVYTIDGVDLVNGNSSSNVDTLNAGLFPSSAGEAHSFLFYHPDSSVTVSLTAGSITTTPVLKTETISTSTGNVGYILFNDHRAPAEEQLITAIDQLKNDNVTDLVLDLRYNGGGLLAIASEISYMIAGPGLSTGRTFEQQNFSDKHPTVNPVTNQAIDPVPFFNEAIGFSAPLGQALPSLDLSRVYVLTSDDTCSASEAIINGLRGINVEVIQIGTSTCGKPYGFYPQDNCGTTYFSIQFSGDNDIGFGDYSDGFSPQNTLNSPGVTIPGCSIIDDYNDELGEAEETLLNAALYYRLSSSCISSPISTNASPIQPLSFSEEQLSLTEPPEYKLLQNRFLTFPGQ